MNLGAFLVAQIEKNLPAMQETRVQSLGWEDSLEKGMATHSSILACRIPLTEETGVKKSDSTEQLNNNNDNSVYLLQFAATSKIPYCITPGLM